MSEYSVYVRSYYSAIDCFGSKFFFLCQIFIKIGFQICQLVRGGIFGYTSLFRLQKGPLCTNTQGHSSHTITGAHLGAPWGETVGSLRDASVIEAHTKHWGRVCMTNVAGASRHVIWDMHGFTQQQQPLRWQNPEVHSLSLPYLRVHGLYDGMWCIYEGM